MMSISRLTVAISLDGRRTAANPGAMAEAPRIDDRDGFTVSSTAIRSEAKAVPNGECRWRTREHESAFRYMNPESIGP